MLNFCINYVFFYFRLKALESQPYTTEEAERAAGMGSYIPPTTQKVSTQDVQTSMDQSDDT